MSCMTRQLGSVTSHVRIGPNDLRPGRVRFNRIRLDLRVHIVIEHDNLAGMGVEVLYLTCVMGVGVLHLTCVQIFIIFLFRGLGGIFVE